MMKIKLIVCLLMLSLGVFSQNTETSGFQVPNFAPKSPEAAAFLKYGEYPVDLSTGVPSVSIPIYTIETKNFKLPITLDYHASGIKVNQEATWVGLGWNLNSGAQIILSVRDDVDENNPYIDEIPDSNAILAYWNMHQYAFNQGPIFNEHLDKSRVKDVYSFSSPTAKGEFYIKNFATNDVVIFPPDAFKVELLGASRANLGFKITDTSGNVYQFTTTKEVSVRTLTHNDTYISAWYVDEIKTPTNDKLNFVYQDDGTLNDYSFTQRVEIKEVGTGCGQPQAVTQNTNSAIINEGGTTMTMSKKIKEIIFNNGQSKVIFEKTNGREDLVNGNGFLNKIEIKQLENNQFIFKKGYSFGYSYSISDDYNALNYQRKRLRLDNVLSLIEGEGHNFIYSDINLPSKTSKSQDFYGYYNGYGNSDMIPKHFFSNPYPMEVGSANRSVNPLVNQAGILKEIHYPTKGWTKFIYETNQYFGVDEFEKYNLKIVSSNTLQGTGTPSLAPNESPGINLIPICNNPNPVNCVQYREVPFEASNAQGQLTFQILNNYGYERKHDYARVRIYNSSGDEIYSSGKIKANQPITYNFNGINSGTILMEAYGAIMSIEGLQLKYVNNNNLTTKNNYSAGLRIRFIENYNHNTNVLSKKEYDYLEPTDVTKSSGKLINNLVTSFSSNTFTNVTISQFNGDCIGCVCLPQSNYTRSYSISSNSRYGIEGNTVVYKYVKEKSSDPLNNKNGYTLYEFNTESDEIPFGDPSVQIYKTWKRGKIVTKKEYRTTLNNDYIIRQETNNYVDDNSKISVINGFKLFRHLSINFSSTENNFNQLDCIYQGISGSCYVPINVFDGVYEVVTYNLPVAWNYLKSQEIAEYFYDSSNIISGTLTTNKTYNYNNPSHLQLTSQVTTNSKGDVLKTEYKYPSDLIGFEQTPYMQQLLDANRIGEPVITKTFNGSTKLTENHSKYGNSTATGNLLLPTEVHTRIGATDINIAAIEDRKIQFTLYDTSGNVQEYKLENGTPVTIIWGYNKTQPIAKIENATYASITPSLISSAQTASDSGNEASLLIALTALRTGLANAMVTTYTYIPLVGVSTITDPKGDTITYAYDSFGRLKNVKDKNGNILSENEYHYKN